MTTPKQSKKAYSEKTSLVSPIPRIGGSGPLACRIKLSSAVLAAADLLAGHEVEITASSGEIVIRKIASPAPPEQPQERPRSAREQQMDDIMEQSRRHEKGLPEAADEPVEPLSDGEAL